MKDHQDYEETAKIRVCYRVRWTAQTREATGTVVKTVVRTFWERLGSLDGMGPRWTIASGQMGHAGAAEMYGTCAIRLKTQSLISG
jgi:hypothetical protein